MPSKTPAKKLAYAKAYAKNYHLKHREEILEKQKTYRLNNKEKLSNLQIKGLKEKP